MKRAFIILTTVMSVFTGVDSNLRADVVDNRDMSPEELLFMEVPAVVTASRMKQPVSEAPSSVSIVTADEIKKYGYRTLADILRSLRGFFIRYDRNYSFAGIRGFSRPGDYNTRVLLLVDGHRINENVYDQAFIGTDFPLDIDLVERVEVIRGPGSSLFGSNAFFAVINVITRQGLDVGGLEVSADAGSFDAYKGRITYGNRYGNGLEALVSGSYYNSRGDRRLFFPEFNTPATNNGIAEGLDHDRFYSTFGKFSFREFTLESAYSWWKKGVPTASFGTVFNDGSFATREEHFFADLKYERDFAADLRIMARLNYNFHNYLGDYPYNVLPEGEPALVVVNKDSGKGMWWGGELQVGKRLFARHRLVAGGEFRDNIRQDQLNFDTDVYLDERRTSTIWALFIQDEIALFKNLLLNAGLRYDHYSTFGSTTNPRIALIYTPFEQTVIKFLYGSAFRAPSASELYYNIPSLGYKTNPDLKPETISTYELIWEQRIGNRLRGTVSGFYNEIDDLINLTLDADDDLLVYRNTGRAETIGVEAELEGRWENGLTGRVSYTFQKTRDAQTGEIMTNTPRHQAKLNLIVPLPGNKLFLGIEEQFTCRRKTLAGNFAGSIYVTNLTLFSRNLLKNLEASAAIYNVFDYRYGDPGSEEHLQDIIRQDGRTFRVKLTYRF